MFHMIFCGKAELPKYLNGQAPPKNECEAWRKLKDNENLPLEYAKDLGLDMNKFVQDFSSDKIKKQMAVEMDQYRKSGIPKLSVPKFLVQGKEYKGQRSVQGFSAIIDAELAKLKK